MLARREMLLRDGDTVLGTHRLMTAAYTQLRLARPLAKDLRRPWEKPAHRAA